ncbi:Protein of unknown function (DUF2975) [Desulfitobacterium dichloroeliminans LMG P-21439]|uniref:DUF2975 domain-containing protein n=1 Tax=Desulfitobacterium dichloroeliminans (strain LMG P-21439 / DCA1) TaxID=871963 RepID=L0FAF6_DESDL|nr:DUF2975 domain-containing protein [Desulfitobacterium dichloroeliminans]AGA69928.1 Protein of unknown function (DUF2975) [Desulfitobacterium dichloroeliminans LMG P-21439]
MVQNDLLRVKNRAGLIHMLVSGALIIGVIIYIAALIAFVFFAFTSPDRFTAVKDNIEWTISFTFGDGAQFFTTIPYKIIQAIDSSRFSAKYAMLAYMGSFFVSFALILYGIKQLITISKSAYSDETPFNVKNSKCLNRLAYSIIIYSATSKLIATLLCAIFATKIFAFDLSSVHFEGIIIGVIVLLISDIFRYGVYLQEEFDTTL